MYQALYRKYRPLLFKDVVGQKAIVKILKNSIINNQVGHAYMFFGPRGTGKTSLAKIFARTINCDNTKDGEICYNCSSCQKMLNDNSVDIVEIDAASNNGVDEIRELKSKINLVPSYLKYKVYIIDEVHMLSIGAFNALLKTLEEPPEHIVFILATTDPQKVPDTIKSRCQCFNFKRISDKEIVEKLLEICTAEDINIEKEVLDRIASASNGGLRDSLSSLDMLYSACGKNITMSDYIQMNDLVSDKEINQFLECILSGKVDEVLLWVENMNASGKNLIQLCDLLLQCSRDLVVGFYRKSLDIDNIDLLEKFVFLLNEKMADVKKASNPRIYIEVMLLKFIYDMIETDQSNNSKIISREIILEQKFDSDSDKSKVLRNEKSCLDQKEEDDIKENFDIEDSYDKIESEFLEKYREVMNIRVNNTFCKADKNILIQVKEKAKKLNDFVFDQKIGYLVCSLMDGNIRVASEESIVISLEYDSMIDANIKNMDQLQKSFSNITGLSQKLAFITDEMWNAKKQEYIVKLHNGENYQYVNEPDLPTIQKKEKRNELVDHAIELFGDIVEEE